MNERKDSVDDLIVLLDARIAALNQQVLALQAAVAALRGLPAPQTVSVPSVWTGDPVAAPGTLPVGRHPAKSKMASHLCAKCNGRTTWDPCHLCGAAVPVMATLATAAPDLRSQDDD